VLLNQDEGGSDGRLIRLSARLCSSGRGLTVPDEGTTTQRRGLVINDARLPRRCRFQGRTQMGHDDGLPLRLTTD